MTLQPCGGLCSKPCRARQIRFASNPLIPRAFGWHEAGSTWSPSEYGCGLYLETARIMNTPEQNSRNLVRVGTNSKPSRVQAVTQFGKKRALSAPENTGRRGRPLLGRAAFRPFQNQIESLPGYGS